ncbi:MAG: N-succinyldiaminopimelate aminotransferase [Solirubrobacteraceae bacterium]|nr:N-succinyldiaminopimelate aminotransferase [Solirubrobacteraceae bacterium]
MIARRLRPFGTTIFTEMSALAARSGALNLGQGSPDTDGPAEVVEAAATALRSGRANQYAPLGGVPELRAAIAAHQLRRYAIELDPDDGIQVTFGATEAIAATMLGLVEPGDAVVVLEPFYDSYGAMIAMADGERRLVTLRPPDFAVDLHALAAAARGARMLLLNSPHNPTGRVLTPAELAGIAAICVEHDLVAVTDEVYEHLVFDGEHVPLATLPGMAERTLTISSLGKTFSVTGWKVGWACGPAPIVAAVRAAKQFLTFAGATPFQHAGAAALRLDDHWYREFSLELEAKRDHLCAGLKQAGLTVLTPQGTYFANADVGTDATEFARELPYKAGVVAIPTAVFSTDAERLRPYLRFAFCKRPAVIDRAARQLAAEDLES